MSILATIAISVFLLVGCVANNGEPTSSRSQIGNFVEPSPLTQPSQITRSEDDQLEVQSLPNNGESLAMKVRSSVGAPIIYSTTGGPFPASGRTKKIHVGANVLQLPDWQRRSFDYSPNNIEMSTGRTEDGESAMRVEEYLLSHMDEVQETESYVDEPVADTSGLASFAVQPTLRLAQGTSEEHAAYTLHAVALINTALPWNKRIRIGSEVPPLTGIQAIPDGQIFVDFAAKSDWIPISDAPALHIPRYEYRYDEFSQRWEIKSMKAGHIWIDPSAHESQVSYVNTLTQGLLHALGLRGRIYIHRFPQSLLRIPKQGTLPTDIHIPEIDADGLLAIYTRLEPGTDPEYVITAECLIFCLSSLHPWDNNSLRMHGELSNLNGATFGVAFRNDLARPWARGTEPLVFLAENDEVSGSAIWDGTLMGFTPQGRSVVGLAEINVDLATLTGRANFSDLQQWSSAKWQDSGQWSVWGDGDLGYTIVLRGNEFRETGGDHGILTGVFVGGNHEGAVGILERFDLSAAFGGSRPRTSKEPPDTSASDEGYPNDTSDNDDDGISDNNDENWSDSEWVNIHTQWSGQAVQPLPWFGSHYQELYKEAYSSSSIGEIGGVQSCFYKDSIFFDCYDNASAEYIPFYRLVTPSGDVTLLRARGLYGRDNEEVGAFMGFTDWGYWAAGWSAQTGDVYSTLEKGEDRTLLQVFNPVDYYHSDHGDLWGEEYRERLENLPDSDDTWRASYKGLMSGIAHNHGGRPVWGRVHVGAQFDRLNWLEAVNLSMTDIKGTDFTVQDIVFPTIDGDCCNERKENGSIAITSFELDRWDFYVKGHFTGSAHDAVHGVFSNGDVTGGFGALQTQTENRPPLKAE